MLLISAVLGTLIGLVLALTGAGGGILAVPALTLGLGWSMTQASPVALLTIATAAAIGAMAGLAKGRVRYRAALLISISGIIAAPFGQRLAHFSPEHYLIALFASVMLIVAARVFIMAKNLGQHENETDVIRTKSCIVDTGTGRIIWNAGSFMKLCLIGLISGLSTGLLGVGGGFIIVPALLRCSNISMNNIIATSLLVISLISSGAVISAFAMGHVSLSQTALLFIGGAAAGMLLGRRFAEKIPAVYLQKGFAVLLTGIAIILFYKLAH